MDLRFTVTTDEVKAMVVETLGVEDRAGSLGPETRLLGALP